MAIPALLILISAWFIGSQLNHQSIANEIEAHIPQGTKLLNITEGVYTLTDDSSKYYITGEGKGYGGLLRLSIEITATGQIRQVLIINDKETPSFIKKLNNKHFTDSFSRLRWQDVLNNNNLPDAISGATFTSRAITHGVKEASHIFAVDVLEMDDLPELPTEKINWTLSLTLLVIMLALAMLITWPGLRQRIAARWVLMVFNIIFLGFWTGNQISIVQISRLSSGEFPPLAQQLFFYILIGGSVIILLIMNKNLYYDRVCPFGATQECFAALGGTKRIIRDKRNITRWIPRILALSLLTLGLIFRHPSQINYEVFSAFFQLVGNSLQFILLIIVLLTSLFFKRPWCTLLCPVKPVFDFISMLRNWILRNGSE